MLATQYQKTSLLLSIYREIVGNQNLIPPIKWSKKWCEKGSKKWLEKLSENWSKKLSKNSPMILGSNGPVLILPTPQKLWCYVGGRV